MRENIQLQLLLWKSCKEKKAFLLPWIINDVRENWRNYWNWNNLRIQKEQLVVKKRKRGIHLTGNPETFIYCARKKERWNIEEKYMMKKLIWAILPFYAKECSILTDKFYPKMVEMHTNFGLSTETKTP